MVSRCLSRAYAAGDVGRPPQPSAVSGTLVIGNPKAGRGAAGRCWAELLDRLERAGMQPTGRLTEGPGHATDLARQASGDGRELVVALGGDGTVHEVVNGLLAAAEDGPGGRYRNGVSEGDGEGDDQAEVPVLGVIPAGSGCDYARTFALPADLAGAVARLASPVPPRLVDLGEVRCQSASGERVRLFANVAEVGIGAEVAARAAFLPRSLGAGRYVASFALTLLRNRSTDARVDGVGSPYEGTLTNLVVAIGQYFGGGMHIAPTADPADGRFDVQIQFGSKLDYALAMPKVFRGTHLPHPRVREEQTGHVEVTCDPPARVEADGEILGTTPATFTSVPGALRLKT